MQQDPDTPEGSHDGTHDGTHDDSKPPSQSEGDAHTVRYVVITLIIIVFGGLLIAALRRSVG